MRSTNSIFCLSQHIFRRSATRICLRSFSISQPFNKPRNINKFIESVYHELKPPISNKIMYSDGNLLVQVVGGKNSRDDYHINQGEELFYQIQGDMRLDVIEKGKFKEIPIREGELFVLPGGIPHSPQRFSNTVGLVIERRRKKLELDGVRWYIPETNKILHEEWIQVSDLTDLTTKLREAITIFRESEEYKTKKTKKSFKPKQQVNSLIELSDPLQLSKDLIGKKPLFENTSEFVISFLNPGKDPEQLLKHETFYWQIEGYSIVHFPNEGKEKILRQGDICLLKSGTVIQTERPENAFSLSLINRAIH